MVTEDERTVGVGANYQVRALERALDILDAFEPATPKLSLRQLAERTGLPKSTVVRLAAILVDRGYLEKVPGGQGFRIGVRAFEAGCLYIQSASLEAEARPIMARLAEATGQTANLGILDRGELVHIAVEAPDRPVRYWATTGKREDAHYTGLGKVLLAALTEEQLAAHLACRPLVRRTPRTITDPAALRAALAGVRAAGHAVDDEESNAGVCCVAAPVVDGSGATVAAVSVSGSAAEFGEDARPRYVAAVTAAGRQISLRIGAGALQQGQGT